LLGDSFGEILSATLEVSGRLNFWLVAIRMNLVFIVVVVSGNHAAFLHHLSVMVHLLAAFLDLIGGLDQQLGERDDEHGLTVWPCAINRKA
jgi:hypothetical protein